MTSQNYADAKVQQDIIDDMTNLIATKATTGAQAYVIIVDQDGKNVLISANDLKTSLGADYTTICATAFASIGTALATAKSDAETAFGAI